jgi:hypothetical protein
LSRVLNQGFHFFVVHKITYSLCSSRLSLGPEDFAGLNHNVFNQARKASLLDLGPTQYPQQSEVNGNAMAEAVQNKIPPDARCYLSNALSVDRALQPGFGDTDKRDAEISAASALEGRKIFLWARPRVAPKNQLVGGCLIYCLLRFGVLSDRQA